jgi:hypothetical protein
MQMVVTMCRVEQKERRLGFYVWLLTPRLVVIVTGFSGLSGR